MKTSVKIIGKINLPKHKKKVRKSRCLYPFLIEYEEEQRRIYLDNN